MRSKRFIPVAVMAVVLAGGGVAYAAVPHTSHKAGQVCPTTSVGTRVYGAQNIALKCAVEWVPVHPTKAPVVKVTVTVTKTVHATPTPAPTTPDPYSTFTPPPAPPVTPAPPAAPTTVLSQSGNGDTSTAQFTVAGNWQVNYSFDCSNFGQAGNFIIDSDGTGSGYTTVNALAPSGSGTDYVYGGGTYHLTIISECNWSIAVVG